MDKIDSSVLLLGAGASKAFGYPTTTEFLDIIREEVPQKALLGNTIAHLQQRSQATDIESILLSLEELQIWSANLIDNESLAQYLLTKVDKIVHITPSNNHTNFVDYLWQQRRTAEGLINHIHTKIYEKYWGKPPLQGEGYEDYNETYPVFFELFGTPMNIFTTNYDMCIEYSFWDNNASLGSFCDLSKSNQRGTTIGISNLDESSQFRLYKLHGSLNWKQDPIDPQKIHRVNFPDFTKLQDHVMLFPGGKKPTRPPFKEMYDCFSKELQKVDFCIVIGFSFRDAGINKILLDALQFNGTLKIVIWNPIMPKHPFPEDRVVSFIEKFGKDHIDKFVSQMATIKGSVVKSTESHREFRPGRIREMGR